MKRLRLLEKGAIKYRADDRGYRKRKEAINCFHAMAKLDDRFPNGGFLDTGLLMWGLNGTKQVLRDYIANSADKRLLLQPVDIDHDVIGFVFACWSGMRLMSSIPSGRVGLSKVIRGASPSSDSMQGRPNLVLNLP